MADIEARRAHSLSLEDARKVAQQLADQLKDQFQLDSEWHGNTLKFNRSGVKGHVQVSDKDVAVEISLGFMLKAFKGKIQSEVTKNMDKMFA